MSDVKRVFESFSSKLVNTQRNSSFQANALLSGIEVLNPFDLSAEGRACRKHSSTFLTPTTGVQENLTAKEESTMWALQATLSLIRTEIQLAEAEQKEFQGECIQWVRIPAPFVCLQVTI